MRAPRRGVRAVLYYVLLLLVGCAPTTWVSHSCDGPARDHVMLVDRLRCAGLRVDIGEPVTVPQLRVPGVALLLSGGALSGEARVDSFWYDDTDLGTDARAVVRADAAKFARDGSLVDRGNSIYYRGTPHLFRSDRVIAIYAGDDRALLDLLTRLLGPQFAGG